MSVSIAIVVRFKHVGGAVEWASYCNLASMLSATIARCSIYALIPRATLPYFICSSARTAVSIISRWISRMLLAAIVSLSRESDRVSLARASPLWRVCMIYARLDVLVREP